jgi:hypothetical protein
MALNGPKAVDRTILYSANWNIDFANLIPSTTYCNQDCAVVSNKSQFDLYCRHRILKRPKVPNDRPTRAEISRLPPLRPLAGVTESRSLPITHIVRQPALKYLQVCGAVNFSMLAGGLKSRFIRGTAPI